jgi:membrane associated rhomboid family serine protease
MFPIGDENERGHGPAFVSLAFIGLNIAVFLLLQGAGGPSGEEFTYGYAAVPFEITNGVDLVDPEPITIDGQEQLVPQEPGPRPIWLTLLWSMFMHGGWLHIFGNMLFLWIFGDNVEHRIGHIPYALFYIGAGLVASFAQILVNTDSIIPTLGASGAISGVLGAYLVMFPTNRVTVLMLRFPMQVPAIVAIGLWALLQIVSGFGQFGTAGEGGGVAYMAHIGGFVAGVVAGLVFRAIFREPRRPRGAPASAYG